MHLVNILNIECELRFKRIRSCNFMEVRFDVFLKLPSKPWLRSNNRFFFWVLIRVSKEKKNGGCGFARYATSCGKIIGGSSMCDKFQVRDD